MTMTADTVEGGPRESLYRHASQIEIDAEESQDAAANISGISQGRTDFAVLRRRVLTAALAIAGVLAVAGSAWRMGAGVQRQKIAPGSTIEMPLLNTDTYEYSHGTIEYEGTDECMYANKELGNVIQLTKCDLFTGEHHEFLLPRPGQSGPIKMKGNPDWCLDAPDAPAGHQLQFWHCSQCPIKHCVWKMPDDAHGELRLHSDADQCVDVPSKDLVFSQKTLELWPCDDPKEVVNLKFKIHYKGSDVHIKHCRWSPWRQWHCTFVKGKCRSVRGRKVLQEASGGGQPCHGGLFKFGKLCHEKQCLKKSGGTGQLDNTGKNGAFGQSVGVLAPLVALLCAWAQ